jgi:CheY-like chemotaxis protein
MSNPSKRRILVVDDEPTVRETLAKMLRAAGYDVATAENGFEALLQLKRVLPEVIISDLNMPKMSGFELLSVVRRRFPTVAVIASSGAYAHEVVPSGVIADAFYAKGGSHPETLLSTVAGLIRTSASRANAHQKEQAPVWIPRNGKDSNGISYIVLTCTECLRSFPVNVTQEINPEVLQTPCFFCPNTVRYIVDFSLSVASPKASGVEAVC